jgi:hypothetical protein
MIVSSGLPQHGSHGFKDQGGSTIGPDLITITDGRGLFLAVQPNGSKLWRWQYRFQNQYRLMAFGSCPLVRLGDARAAPAAAPRAQLLHGSDPMAERKAEKGAERESKRRTEAEVNGICGNDDVGQNVYPVCPGASIYVIGSPLSTRATIRLDPQWDAGQTFTVVARGNSATNLYVQSARLNGKALNRPWIKHEEIAAGGTLEFEMGPEPNLQWGDLPRFCHPAA